jgi:hypothetical protein
LAELAVEQVAESGCVPVAVVASTAASRSFLIRRKLTDRERPDARVMGADPGLALPDGSGPVNETGRYTRGTGVVTPLDFLPAPNPVDMGWSAVRPCPPFRAGNFWSGIDSLGWEVTVKDYGVAVARPQG